MKKSVASAEILMRETSLTSMVTCGYLPAKLTGVCLHNLIRNGNALRSFWKRERINCQHANKYKSLVTLQSATSLEVTKVIVLIRLCPEIWLSVTWPNNVKTESTRKLSNQWTKTLYQNNLKFIAFFFTLFKSYRRN